MERSLAYTNLISHISTQNGPIGLFYGNMGICLSLYMLNQIYPDKQTENEGERILDYILDNIHYVKDTSFSKGIAGIGWALNILLQSKCISGNSNDIFFDIDAAIYKNIFGDYNVKYNIHDGKLGCLLYLIERLKGLSNNECSLQKRLMVAAVRKVIDQLYADTPTLMSDISRDLYITAYWKYPLLFFLLGQMCDLNVYENKIRAITAEWSLYIEGSFPYHVINRIILSVSLANLNKRLHFDWIENHIRRLLFQINEQSIINETDCRYTRISEGWIFVVCMLILAENSLVDYVAEKSIFSNAKRLILNMNKMNLIKIQAYWPGFDIKTDISAEKFAIDLANGISGIILIFSMYPHIARDFVI